MILLVKLLVAHLAGDFVLQSNAWVKHKEQHKWKSGYLYLHTALHFLLILAVTWQPAFWQQALAIAASHFLIDGVKLSFQKENNKRAWFFIDQALHLAVIGAVWFYTVKASFDFQPLWAETDWYVLAGAVFLTKPASVLIRLLMAQWSLNTGDDAAESLKNAGQYIGILERLFVFVFILLGQWEAIGFLLAAKSIFRFGDLTTAKDRKLTEYILIGTLLSFGLATLTGIIIGSLKVTMP